MIVGVVVIMDPSGASGDAATGTADATFQMNEICVVSNPSDALTVVVKAPGVVGAPENAPVVEFSATPGGSACALHVRGSLSASVAFSASATGTLW